MNERVAVLCFSPAPTFEMAVPCEVFGIDRTAMGVPRSEVRVVAGEAGRLVSNVGFGIDTRFGLSTLRWADLVCVPGWPHARIGRPIPDAVVSELRRAHRRGTRIVSFCSGAFVLAGAGLLHGRCTTHWMHVAALAALHPELDIDPDVLYVGDGQVFTSAGTASAIDLCLHLVRTVHGAEVANTVARRMVVPAHRNGGQAQYVEAPVATLATDDLLTLTLDWAMAHLDHGLTVEDLARRAATSPRTFARRFKVSTGTTPLQWLVAQRVVLAQRLLESTTAGIEEVAQQCGFGSAATLRQHFGRMVGTTPVAYRHAFRRGEPPNGSVNRSMDEAVG